MKTRCRGRWRWILLLAAWATAWSTGPLAGQEAVDTSGLTLFWAAADRLSAGDDLLAADWDALFEHAGYAVTEDAGQRRSVITHCMTAVFSPGGDPDSALQQLPEGDGRTSLYQRVCAHLQEVRDRREELEAYFADFAATRLSREGRARAARYLPEEVMSRVTPPPVYVILFEEQGFGRPDAIVVDGLAVMLRSDDRNADFLGHEYHHAYRSAIRARLPDGPEAALLGPLDRIVREGVASMIDKAADVRAGTIPFGFPPDFLALVEQAPTRLARIDSALTAAEPTPEGLAAAGRAVNENSPWGGHLNGVYMAMAIEEAFGTREVVAAQRDPAAFFTTYQRAVEALADGRFRFSERSIEVITGAMAGPQAG